MAERIDAGWTDELTVSQALQLAVSALAGPERTLTGDDLEVAVLERRRPAVLPPAHRPRGRRHHRRAGPAAAEPPRTDPGAATSALLGAGAGYPPAMERRIFGVENEYGSPAPCAASAA
ncbi:MAG: hypothetical protein R2755_10670 [Acidimicrobiales bacterium]